MCLNEQGNTEENAPQQGSDKAVVYKLTVIHEPKAAQPPVLVVGQLFELRHHSTLEPLQRVVQRFLLTQAHLRVFVRQCDFSNAK